MPSKNEIISFFREQLKAAHQLLEGTVADVTSEQANWIPPGIANPLGATYAHIILSEDGAINAMLKGQAPLFASGWAGRTGVSELPPMPNPAAPGFPDWSAWGRGNKVDISRLRQYAQAVYQSSDTYLASLTDEDLDRPVNLSAVGLGESNLRFLLVNGILGNALTHCGEIACLKGLQKGRGYPF